MARIPKLLRELVEKQNNKTITDSERSILLSFLQDEDDEDDEDDDDIPEGCRACGGPYPSCTSSCPLFDD